MIHDQHLRQFALIGGRIGLLARHHRPRSLARETPAVYVIEDAHWIDEVSESMLVDFLTVVPQTPSLMFVSYRPEYEGALARVHGAQTHACAQPVSASLDEGSRPLSLEGGVGSVVEVVE